MADITDGLLPFVPSMIISHVLNSPTFPEKPITENFKAAALFTDISGFTPLTERMAGQGPQGIEMLSRILNDYFGKLTDQIAAHGGDVVNFAGDSLLAIWKIKNDETQEMILDQVSQCAQRIQKQLHNYETGTSGKLSMRIGVGMGDIHVFYLGGVDDTWEFIVTGKGVEQAHAAEKLATPGEVILSASVWNILKQSSDCQGEALTEGNIRLTIAPDTFMPQSPALQSLAEGAGKSLQRFIPRTVSSHLFANQMDWLAEFRRLTVVFVNLKGFNSATSLDHAGQVVHAVQETASHFEGFINKFGMDEKGVTPLLIFGAPPFAHEDDSIRGVMAALEISKKLTALNQAHSIGITTGRAFCGAVGGTHRREYTTMGDVINTSARLMQAASSGEESSYILCDAITQARAGVRLKFSSSKQIQLKGKSEAVVAFHPLEEQGSIRRSSQDNPFVGRESEKKLLRDALTKVADEKSKCVIVLEGEAGIGKSRLVDFIRQMAHEFNATYFSCEADAVEKNTSYFSWRRAFHHLLGLDNVHEITERREKALASLPEKWRERAALLNPILGLDIDEPDFVREMSGEVRAENIRALLVDLLQRVDKTPLVIVVEDAHWQDSASWALTLDAGKLVDSLLLVIVTRPLNEPLPSHYKSLFASDNTQHIALGPLSPEETLQLVRNRLHVDSLPNEMVELIRTKAEGNPFFSEELAYSLRDSGLIKVENRACRIMPGLDWKTFSFPDTVQGVVTTRIDRLPAQEQLCIKIASVIGRIFTYQLLHDIHPIENDKQYMQAYLKELEKLDFTPLETVNPELTYIFKHAITQDVAYNLMLFAQRQELHTSVAEWYEQKFADDLPTLYPALAHHWRYAGNHEKAVHYLDLAAQQALDTFANREAIDFLNLIAQIKSQSTVKDNFHNAQRERRLGQAHKGLGEMETSRDHLRESLKWMKYPSPRNDAGWIFDLLGQLMRRAIIPARQITSDSPEAKQDNEAILAYETLSEIYFYAIDTPAFLACLLRLLNLVDKFGVSSATSRAYSMASLVAGLIPLHGIARKYEKRALEIANSLGQFDGLAFSLSCLSLYNLGAGEFEQAYNNMTRAVESVTFLNNRPRMSEVFTTMAQVFQRSGRYVEGYEYFERAYQSGVREENPQHQVWGLTGKAGILLYQGGENHAQQAATLLNQSLPLLVGSTDHTEDIRTNGLLSVAYTRLAELDKARQAADRGLHFITTTSPTAHDGFEGFAGVAETYLVLLQANPTDQELSKSTNKALKGLLKCAQLFPIAMPRYWCYMGTQAWIQGKKNHAFACWKKGLSLAQKLNMIYEEARLLYELGSHDESPDGKEKLIQASDRFRSLEALYDREKTSATLTSRAGN